MDTAISRFVRDPGTTSSQNSLFVRDNKYLDDGLSGYYIFGEVLESTGFEYPNVSIVITNDSDDQSVVTPAGMSDIRFLLQPSQA